MKSRIDLFWTVILCIPSFLKSSGSFAYGHYIFHLKLGRNLTALHYRTQIRLGSVRLFPCVTHCMLLVTLDPIKRFMGQLTIARFR